MLKKNTESMLMNKFGNKIVREKAVVGLIEQRKLELCGLHLYDKRRTTTIER